jgi:hypothetical protein
MSAASELIQAVEENGGHIRVEDGCLVIAPGEAAAPVMQELRQHKPKIIRLLQSRDLPTHDPAEWRPPFARWLDAACFRSPRWFTNAAHLHSAFCDWETARGEVPCRPDTFERLLEEWDFLIGEVDGVVLVFGLALREDL